jgi:glycosyltransferase involved in cell wall biosynthesis
MKITFFSVVRYPTEKAYGVTIFYSMQALEELGHQVSIISPDNLNTFGEILNKKRFLNFILYKIINNKQKLFPKWVFILQRLIIARLSIYAIPNTNEILWVRDPLIGLLNFRRPFCRKVVLEIHQPLKLIEKAMLKIIGSSNKLIIAPISLNLYSSLNNSKFRFDKNSIVLSPMGVPNSFFIKNNFKNESAMLFNEFRIGYVGGAYSAGVDQSIDSLIICIGQFNNIHSSTRATLSIFGLEEEILTRFQLQFRNLIDNQILFLYARQNHDKLISKLQECNLFILPYPEGKYHKSRFPIKAMEYAALSRPILVTNTVSHRNIFESSEVWFYDPLRCESLHNAMLDIKNDLSLTKNKIELVYDKSLNFTYQKRVMNILRLT